MDLAQLYNLVPQGASVLAVLFVVLVFLKQQDKKDVLFTGTLKTISEKAHDSHSEARKDYQTQVGQLVSRYEVSAEKQSAATKDLESAIRQLTNTVLLMGRENITK